MSDETSTSRISEKRARFEAEKLNRRDMMRRFGFRAAGAVLASFAIDDIARSTIKHMQEQKMLHGVADSVAQEFSHVGVAYASGVPCSRRTDCDCICQCSCKKGECREACGPAPFGCDPAGGSLWPWCAEYYLCLAGCSTAQKNCVSDCPADGTRKSNPGVGKNVNSNTAATTH